MSGDIVNTYFHKYSGLGFHEQWVTAVSPGVMPRHKATTVLIKEKKLF